MIGKEKKNMHKPHDINHPFPGKKQSKKAISKKNY